MLIMILLIINIHTQMFEIFIPPKCVYTYVLYNIKRLHKLSNFISPPRIYHTIDCYEMILIVSTNF